MSLYSRDKARSSLIDTAAYRALSQVATVLGYIVMVRAMGQADFGVYNLLYAFLPAVSTVASLGLDQVLRRYQPEYLRAGNLPAALWLVRVIGSTRFAANLVILAAVLLAWNTVAPPFKLGPYRLQFALFSLLVLLHFQCLILQYALSGHMLHRYSVGATAMLAYCKLAGYGLLALTGRFSIEAAILVDTAGYAVAWFILRRAYRTQCIPPGPQEPFVPAPAEKKRLVRYGLYNNFNDAGTLLLSSRSDNFFIAAFIDPISVGIYSFYTRLNEMIGNVLPVRLFENVVNPLFFSMPPHEAGRKIPQYFSLLLNMNLLLQWPLFAFTLAHHEQIVRFVFGGKFVEHSWLMPIVVGFGLLAAIAIPVTLVAQYYERARVILFSKVFAGVNVVLLLLLVPKFGVYGAALATGLSTFGKNIFVWTFVRRSAVWLNAVPALASSIAIWGTAVAVCWGLRHHWLHGPDLLQLVVGALVFGAAGLVYLRSPALSSSDRAILSSVMRGKEAGILRWFGVLERSRE